MAAPDGPHETAARAAAERARRMPPSGAPLLASHGQGPAALSPAGRNFFARVVDTPVDSARIHIDTRAAAIASAAQARGVAYGRDVFLAAPHAALDDGQARGVLAHELAHVGQHRGDAPTIYRDGPARYPTESQQQTIEELVKRARPEVATPAPTPAPTTSGTPAPSPPPVVRRGRSLSTAERSALAARLVPELYTTLESLGGTSVGTPTVDSADEAMALARRARAAIIERYGSYIPQMFTLTDAAGRVADRIRNNQVQVLFGAGPNDGRALARSVIGRECTACSRGLDDLDDESRQAVIDEMMAIAMRQRGADFTLRARALVGGSYSRGRRQIRISEFTPTPFGTAVHELIHAAVHPAFYAAFIDERIMVEGFTEHFTRQLVPSRTSYQDFLPQIRGVRSTLSSSPWLFESDSAAAEESLRRAYFGGRLDLIGWRPTPAENVAVTAAGGAPAWDPNVAATEAAAYERRMQAAQDPHDNLLGVGILFQNEGEMALSVRYARVFANLDPLQRGRLYVEGQLQGSAQSDPRLGGSLGLGIEYQEPWFFATGGLRLTGSAAVTGDPAPRVDVAPFLGLGIRAWQRVRIGAEAVVLLPVTSGQSVQVGGGGSVIVEF